MTNPTDTIIEEPMRDPDTGDGNDGTQLSFADTVTIGTNTKQLWETISDPDVLARCIPGAERVEQLSERKYAVEVTRGISRLSLSFAGEIELVETHEPNWLLAEGSAYDSKTHTEFDGIAGMELVDAEDGTAELSYEAHLTFTGGTGTLTTTLLRPIVESDVNRYFENVKAEIHERCGSEASRS